VDNTTPKITYVTEWEYYTVPEDESSGHNWIIVEQNGRKVNTQDLSIERNENKNNENNDLAEEAVAADLKTVARRLQDQLEASLIRM